MGKPNNNNNTKKEEKDGKENSKYQRISDCGVVWATTIAFVFKGMTTLLWYTRFASFSSLVAIAAFDSLRALTWNGSR